jgi:hypothetical protein
MPLSVPAVGFVLAFLNIRLPCESSIVTGPGVGPGGCGGSRRPVLFPSTIVVVCYMRCDFDASVLFALICMKISLGDMRPTGS